MRCLRCGTENPENANDCSKCKATLKRVCPRCRTINHQKQVFCGNCGLKLINICPRCKAQNSPVQKFCGNCGLKIINFCQKCGMNNPVGQRFCGNCATRLLTEQSQKPTQQDKHGTRKPDQQPQRPAEQAQMPKKLPQRPVKSSVHQQEQRPAQNTARPSEPIKTAPTVAPKMQEPPKATPVAAPKIQEPRKQPIQEPKMVEKRQPAIQETKPAIKEPQIKPQQLIEKPEPEIKPEVPKIQVPVQPAETLNIVKEEPVIQNIQQEIPIVQTTIPPIKAPEIKEQAILEMPILQSKTEELKQASTSEAKKPSLTDKINDINISKDTVIEEKQVIDLEDKDLIPYNKHHDQEDEIIIEEDDHEPIIPVVQKKIDQKPKPPERAVLKRFAVFSLEIINYNMLLQKLEATVVNNIKERLWSIINETVVKCGEKISNTSENSCIVSFSHSENKKASSIRAMQSAGQILGQASILNEQLQTVLNTQIKLKIGVALNDAEGFSQLERSIASAWSVVVSEEIKEDTEEFCEYDTIGPLPIGNQMITYYKYKIPEQPGQLLNAQMNSMPQTQQLDADGNIPESHINTTPSSLSEPIPDIKTKICDKNDIVNNLMNICSLTDSTKSGQFVSIIAEDGLGKSSSIRELKSSLSPQSFIWMIARCNYQEKNMPLSTVRCLLRNFIGLPNIVHNRQEAKNIIKKAIQSVPGATEQIQQVIYALLLGEETTGLNKNHIISTIFTIVRGITEKATAIIVIEDLDAIDNTSMEIFESLIEARLLDLKVVFIATFHPNLNFVETKPHLVKHIKYVQMAIPPLPLETTPQVIQQIIQSPIEIPDAIMNHIIQASNGIPLITENALFLMYELGVIVNTEQGPVFNQEAAKWEPPNNIQEILRLRLHRLSQVNPNAFMVMQLAATLGPKFSPGALKDLSMLGKDFDENMQFLSSLGYFILEDTNTMIFKHNIMWELVYYYATPNEAKSQNHMHILNYLEQTVQAGGCVDLPYLAFHAENAGKKRKSLNYWNLVANQILALDISSGYSETMLRYISILDECNIPNKQELQINALEGIGKVSHITDPVLAIQTFEKVLPIRESEGNVAKLLELRGYLSLSLEQQGRWDDSIEQINKSLELINSDTMHIERAMLLTNLISPMENMGKTGWIINTCNNEIFPIIEPIIHNKQIPEGMTEEQLFRVYCNAKISFAKALITSGHHEAFNIFNEIMPEIETRGLQDLGLKAYILQAKWRAIRGELEFSEKILTQTREYLSQMPGINPFTLLWGEAACQLNLEAGNWEGVRGLMDGLRMQAQKLNNYPVIALTMICKGLLQQMEGRNAEALETFGEAVNYASKYKLTTYALMCWYYIAASELQSENFEKAESIATKALNVAKMPDVYNLSAIITLNRLMGEIYIKKGVLEESGGYLEEAWKVATEIQNHAQVAKVAVVIGQMYQELITYSEENKKENAAKAYEFYSNALNIFQQLSHPLHCKRVEKSIENLKIVCKINSIDI